MLVLVFPVGITLTRRHKLDRGQKTGFYNSDVRKENLLYIRKKKNRGKSHPTNQKIKI